MKPLKPEYYDKMNLSQLFELAGYQKAWETLNTSPYSETSLNEQKQIEQLHNDFIDYLTELFE